MSRSSKTIGILAVTQIVSWGTLYYAFTILAAGMQRDLGLAPERVFGAFSWGLLTAGLAAAPAGILLDRYGGRHVMALGSLACAIGLAMLSQAGGALSLYIAWTLIGAAMAVTLYEAAFATINRKYETGSRQAMSTLTLFGGFASTLFWPLTASMDSALGWRDTYRCFALMQVLLCMPLHLWLDADPARQARPHRREGHSGQTLKQALRHPAFWTLALAFSANTFVFSAMSAHLLPLLGRLGLSLSTAVLLASLIGPMQVAGRLGEMTFGRHAPPQTIGMLTFAMLPAALLVLGLSGSRAWMAALFCMLYGMSNGIMTILRGAIPQALFGRAEYGAIAGAMAGPSLLAKAAGPFAAAMLLRPEGGATTLLAVLFTVSSASLVFYLRAVKTARAIDRESL